MARAMRKSPCSLDAHDHYLRSRSLLEHMNKTDNLAAREEAEAAIRLDPEYAGGYVMAALTYILEGFQCWGKDPIAALKRGRTHALRAVALDDRFFWSHTTLGAADTWLGNHDKALAELERGVELNPNHADCLALLSAALNFAGRPEEGLRAIHSAIERNPYHPGFYLAMLGRAQFMLGHYPEAIEALERLVNAMPEFTVGRALLTATYAAVDRDADAREQIQEILEITPTFTLTAISRANPYKQPEDLEHYLSLLRKAGLPE